MTTIDLIALPHVLRELIALVEAGETVQPYRSILLRTCNGELPQTQFQRGRWYVTRDQLRKIAQALGLRLKRSALPRTSTRRSAARFRTGEPPATRIAGARLNKHS
jgi:hypothetical protein